MMHPRSLIVVLGLSLSATASYACSRAQGQFATASNLPNPSKLTLYANGQGHLTEQSTDEDKTTVSSVSFRWKTMSGSIRFDYTSDRVYYDATTRQEVKRTPRASVGGIPLGADWIPCSYDGSKLRMKGKTYHRVGAADGSGGSGSGGSAGSGKGAAGSNTKPKSNADRIVDRTRLMHIPVPNPRPQINAGPSPSQLDLTKTKNSQGKTPGKNSNNSGTAKPKPGSADYASFNSTKNKKTGGNTSGKSGQSSGATKNKPGAAGMIDAATFQSMIEQHLNTMGINWQELGISRAEYQAALQQVFAQISAMGEGGINPSDPAFQQIIMNFINIFQNNIIQINGSASSGDSSGGRGSKEEIQGFPDSRVVGSGYVGGALVDMKGPKQPVSSTPDRQRLQRGTLDPTPLTDAPPTIQHRPDQKQRNNTKPLPPRKK